MPDQHSKSVEGELVNPEPRGLQRQADSKFGSHNPVYLQVDMRQVPDDPGSIGFALEKERMERLNDEIAGKMARLDAKLAKQEAREREQQAQLDEQAAYIEEQERESERLASRSLLDKILGR